jgi:hypothetical protein
MVPILQSDATALEHILSQLLEQPSIVASDVTVPPFCGCLSKDGVTLASDFISASPDTYGSILFHRQRMATRLPNLI